MKAKFVNEKFEDYLLDSLSELYDIYKDQNNNTIIQIKSKDSFPYKIKEINGEFILYQQFSSRSYITPVYNRIKSFDSIDKLYNFIIKRHNKSSKYMSWSKINTKKDFYKDFGFSDKEIKKLI